MERLKAYDDQNAVLVYMRLMAFASQFVDVQEQLGIHLSCQGELSSEPSSASSVLALLQSHH
jgi:hypothetical protein